MTTSFLRKIIVPVVTALCAFSVIAALLISVTLNHGATKQQVASTVYQKNINDYFYNSTLGPGTDTTSEYPCVLQAVTAPLPLEEVQISQFLLSRAMLVRGAQADFVNEINYFTLLEYTATVVSASTKTYAFTVEPYKLQDKYIGNVQYIRVNVTITTKVYLSSVLKADVNRYAKLNDVSQNQYSSLPAYGSFDPSFNQFTGDVYGNLMRAVDARFSPSGMHTGTLNVNQIIVDPDAEQAITWVPSYDQYLVPIMPYHFSTLYVSINDDPSDSVKVNLLFNYQRTLLVPGLVNDDGVALVTDLPNEPSIDTTFLQRPNAETIIAAFKNANRNFFDNAELENITIQANTPEIADDNKSGFCVFRTLKGSEKYYNYDRNGETLRINFTIHERAPLTDGVNINVSQFTPTVLSGQTGYTNNIKINVSSNTVGGFIFWEHPDFADIIFYLREFDRSSKYATGTNLNSSVIWDDIGVKVLEIPIFRLDPNYGNVYEVTLVGKPTSLVYDSTVTLKVYYVLYQFYEEDELKTLKNQININSTSFGEVDEATHYGYKHDIYINENEAKGGFIIPYDEEQELITREELIDLMIRYDNQTLFPITGTGLNEYVIWTDLVFDIVAEPIFSANLTYHDVFEVLITVTPDSINYKPESQSLRVIYSFYPPVDLVDGENINVTAFVPESFDADIGDDFAIGYLGLVTFPSTRTVGMWVFHAIPVFADWMYVLMVFDAHTDYPNTGTDINTSVNWSHIQIAQDATPYTTIPNYGVIYRVVLTGLPNDRFYTQNIEYELFFVLWP